MPASTLVIPDVDSPEGYEQELDVHTQGIGAAGFFPQKDTGAADMAAGMERDSSGNLIFKDGVTGGPYTLADLLAGTAGLTANQHKTLLHLIHFIDEGPADGFTTGATKTVTGTVFPTNILWKRADATKLVEKLITWTGVKPTTIQWKMYDTDGSTVLATVTDTISFSGVFETGRTRAIV